jgi:carbon-monoxide dehydrogenase large subunit
MSASDHSAEMRPGLVGKRIKRTEDPRLLTGNGRYVDDIRLPDMLHVAIRRSDQPHARIRDIDVSGAIELPGVVGIFDATRPRTPLSMSKSTMSRFPSRSARWMR